jgi:hypothetical protein
VINFYLRRVAADIALCSEVSRILLQLFCESPLEKLQKEKIAKFYFLAALRKHFLFPRATTGFLSKPFGGYNGVVRTLYSKLYTFFPIWEGFGKRCFDPEPTDAQFAQKAQG